MLQQQAAAERQRQQQLAQMQLHMQHHGVQSERQEQQGVPAGVQQPLIGGALTRSFGGGIIPAAWLPRLESHALHNITRSVHLRHFSSTGAVHVSGGGQVLASPPPRPHHARGFTAEDFDLDDPYAEGGEDEGRPGSRPVALLPRVPEREEYVQAQRQQPQQQEPNKSGTWQVGTEEERWMKEKGETK